MLRIVVLSLEECVGRSSWSDPSRGVITHEHKPSREREGGREGEISVCVVYMLNVCVCVCRYMRTWLHYRPHHKQLFVVKNAHVNIKYTCTGCRSLVLTCSQTNHSRVGGQLLLQ